MKQPNAQLKLAAVASSVLLVGGFIAYRVGAFDRFAGIGPGPNAAGGSPTVPAVQQDMFSSSKSGVAFPVGTSQPTSDPVIYKVDPVVLGGSKSAPVFVPTGEPWANAPPPPAPESTLLGGSKSDIIIVIPPGVPTVGPPATGRPSEQGPPPAAE